MRFRFVLLSEGAPILVCPRAVLGRENQTRGYEFYAIALLEAQFLIKIALREGQFCTDLDVWVCVLNPCLAVLSIDDTFLNEIITYFCTIINKAHEQTRDIQQGSNS